MAQAKYHHEIAGDNWRGARWRGSIKRKHSKK